MDVKTQLPNLPQLLFIIWTSPDLPDARLGFIPLQELVRLSALNVPTSQVRHLPSSFNYLSPLLHFYPVSQLVE